MRQKADSPPYAETEDAGIRSDRGSTAGTPRWVKVFGLVVLVVVLLFVILRVTGVGGQHGPGRHATSGDDRPAGDTVSRSPPAGVMTASHSGPPPGVTHP